VVGASAGPYANLHLAQADNHASIPPLSFLYKADALLTAQPTASKHNMIYLFIVQLSEFSGDNDLVQK